jgi:predicted DNA binding CopG/RHH family protein
MKIKKGLQKLKKKDISQLSNTDATQIAKFLEDFQHMIAGVDDKTKMISLRVPANILSAFKFKAERQNLKYQSLIIDLMRKWVQEQSQ